MCGMWGAAALNKLCAVDITRLADLCVLSWVRGTDSTGMFDVVPDNKKHPLKVYKTLVHPFDFATINIPNAMTNRWKDNMPSVVAGHNRYATVGKISQKNCHPFATDKIVGMHNGTIQGDFTGKKDYETDSEGLINLISKVGIEDAIADLDGWKAAYALIWLDPNKKKLFFLRNKERTLSYVKYAGTLFWASEMRFLTFMMDSHRSVAVAPTRLKEDVLYSLDLSEKATELEEEKEIRPRFRQTYHHENWNKRFDEYTDVEWLPAPTTTEGIIKRFEREIAEAEADIARVIGYGTKEKSNFYEHHDKFSDRWFTPHQIGMIERHRNKLETAIKSLKLYTESQKNKNAVVPFVGPVQKKEAATSILTYPFGTKGDKCSLGKYKEKLKEGCLGCNKTPSLSESLYWLDEKQFVCEKCQDEEVGNKHSWLTYVPNFDADSFYDFVAKRMDKEDQKEMANSMRRVH